jgi:hypothetical protein
VLDARTRYYQRLLARDQDEATDIAEEELETKPLEEVADELLIPALTWAKRDFENDRLAAHEVQAIFTATREIAEQLGAREQKEEPAKQPASMSALTAPPRIHVLACPARDEADEAALAMFRPLLDPAKCDLELTSSELLASELVSLVEEQRPAIVCIAALPPGGLAHTRYLCLRLRARFPELKIVVGRWGLESNVERNQEVLAAAGADHVGLTLVETRNQVNQLIQILSSQELAAV